MGADRRLPASENTGPLFDKMVARLPNVPDLVTNVVHGPTWILCQERRDR